MMNAPNGQVNMPENIDEVVRQTAFTFDEDRLVIEAQYNNMRAFGEQAKWIDIHVDVGANRARRIVAKLSESAQAESAAEV
jgi:ABC-type enterochelin transport system substrate-binding protein